MYVRVYSPNGEPFDVTRDRANRLILDDGWTQMPVTIEESLEIPPYDTEWDSEPPFED